jgi:ferrous iron transport protein A
LRTTIYSLKRGQGIIKDFDIDIIPLKLLEMGCLPEIELLQIAPFGDPLYLNINSHLAIRVETAQEIEVELIKIKL